MKKSFLTMAAGILSGIVLVLGLTGEARADPLFAPPQLDQMLAPIALYPDPLVAQILVAATYPLEIVEAARWAQEPDNARLRGEALENALAPQDWDPSVKSLIPFPQILQMMNTQLAWTQQLGDAFLAQQADVMAAVQRLRAQAQAAGTLYTTPQEVVGIDGSDVTIVPADPQMIYVPTYNPVATYGYWPYPDYPPYYFGGADGYAGIGFGYTVIVVERLWGWGNCDWRHRRIHVDGPRFNAINHVGGINARRPPLVGSIWQHDSYHRHGVAYRDTATRERFAPGAAGSPETRRAFRGYDVNRPAPAFVPAPRAPAEIQRVVPQAPFPSRGPNEGAMSPAQREREIHAPPPAFGHITAGHDVRMEAERGHESRQSFQLPGGSSPGGPAPAAAPRRYEPARGAPNNGDRRSR